MVLVNYFKDIFLTLLLVMIITGITFYSINVYFPKVQKNKIMEEYNILNENFIKNENYIVKNMFFNNDNVCHENIKNKVKYTLMIK